MKISVPPEKLRPVFLLICFVFLLGRSSSAQEPEPHRDTFTSALKEAALAPSTWVPLALTLPFLIDHGDRRFAARMRERQDLFDGQALDRSDSLRDALKWTIWVTALAPNDCPRGQFFCQKKWERLGFTGLSLLTHRNIVGSLKDNIHRARPLTSLSAIESGEGIDSMPSAHSADAFFGATLSSRHIGDTDWHPYLKRAVQTTLWGTAAAVALARIEGGMHYPTDVLVGAAAGSFFATFFHSVFTARNPQLRDRLEVGAMGPNLYLRYHF